MAARGAESAAGIPPQNYTNSPIEPAHDRRNLGSLPCVVMTPNLPAVLEICEKTEERSPIACFQHKHQDAELAPKKSIPARSVPAAKHMTGLKDKIQNGLDESRMLVLGAQILIGFAFSATFESGFAKLTPASRALNLIALALLLISICLLISPAPFHQLAEKGQDTRRLQHFTNHVMEAALLPFALGLGADIFIPAEEICRRPTAIAAAAGTVCLALIFWYGPFLITGKARKGKNKESAMTPTLKFETQTSAHDKVRNVLTEARVILPGNQALLGFQFAVILQQGFRDLPEALKLIHLVSLFLIAISTILLLSPAPYHRIVEGGEETERFYGVANRLVLASLPPMAAGICAEFLIVIYKMTEQWTHSIGAALAMFCIFCFLWFAYPVFSKTTARSMR